MATKLIELEDGTLVEVEVSENLKLQLKKKATFIAPVMQGIPFLGFRIFPGIIRLKHDTLVRFKRKFRLLTE